MGIQIKKFRASTLQKAIEDVRADLGDDAIILQTETLRDPKLGILGRTQVEVTAAIDRKETIRFHATVGEDAGERQVAGTGTSNQKPWWKAMMPGQKVDAGARVSPNPAAAKTPAQTQKSAAPAPESMNQLYAIKTFVEPLQREINELKAKMQAPAVVPTKPTRKKLKDPLEIEVQQLRSELSSFILEKRYETLNLPSFVRQLVNFWTSKGMSGRQILTFLKQIEESGASLSADVDAIQSLSDALALKIQEAPIFDKQEPRIVVLVGATGVGKTTTIAKMAAYEKIRLKRSVAFVSLDDYKVGGADQLGNYARILEVPFNRPRKDMSLEEQLSVQSADTIFVDTFGIAPKDSEKIENLKSMLNFQDPSLASRLEIHLVVPVGIAPKDVKGVLESFETFAPKYLLFTKWDETENWGGMLSAILEAKKPVSLVCYGQNVPDDMSVFSSQKFISTVTDLDVGENFN